MKTRASRLTPPLLDVLLAGALLLAAELEAVLEPVSVPRWVDGLLVLGFTVPLAWRRRAPLDLRLRDGPRPARKQPAGAPRVTRGLTGPVGRP
jgi:hypothetical protein